MRFLTAPPLSHTGGRRVNEDHAGWAEAGGCTCWALADGLGGHAAGEVASEVAIEAALSAFRADPAADGPHLADYVDGAHRTILRVQAGQPDLASMRTTLVVLVAGSTGTACWSHVGDSRLYAFRDAAVVAQTADHSVPQALVDAGQIGPADVRRHPDRNRLLQALGGRSCPRPAVGAPFEVFPNDAFLLCSDGFWELVDEGEMIADLTEARDPAGWLGALEHRLLARATGRHDNYTAVGVWAAS